MMLNPDHEIYKLTNEIDWSHLQNEMRKIYGNADSAKYRLIAGMLYLKVMSGYSSREVVSRWLECPYCRYFCGVDPRQEITEFPYRPVVIDIWEREISGAGVKAMNFALAKSTLIKQVA